MLLLFGSYNREYEYMLYRDYSMDYIPLLSIKNQ